MSYNLVFIGAGKLATQLSVAALKKGFSTVQVYSRTTESAKKLADKLGAEYTNDVENIILGADMYFVTITDSAFEEVLPKINFNEERYKDEMQRLRN